MSKKTGYYLFSFLLLGVVIYTYFLKWRIETIYGDDLVVYQYYTGLTDYFHKINVSLYLSGKYRPISSYFLHLAVIFFQKNLFAYFIFNVVVQAFSALLFLRIMNIFLDNKWVALLFSMVFAVSRFSYYNVSQLYNGGAMESPAMIFFLSTLFFIIKLFTNPTATDRQKQNWTLWGILLANVCIYTHERYIVLFPFIMLIVMFYNPLKTLGNGKKIFLSLLCVVSIVANVAIKEHIFSVPFFAGTGNTNIEFSLSNALSFLLEGLLSIFYINTGPEYLVGFQFRSLSTAQKIFVLLPVLYIIGVFAFFTVKILKASFLSFLSRFIEPSALRQKPEMPHHASLSFYLVILFFLLLAPAVVTIRLEQRWLEASFSIFLLLTAIALMNLNISNAVIKYSVFSILIAAFLAIDNTYLKKGIDNLFMRDAERSALVFKNAINDGTVRPNTTTLYFMLKHRDLNAENGFIWAVRDGYLFDFYQRKSKKIVFVDSVYERTISATDTTFSHFNKQTDQIIYTKGNVIDVTNEYLKDSLRTFKFE